MSMPGFNALVSLYEAKGHYHARSKGNSRGNGITLAQLMPLAAPAPVFDPCLHCLSLPTPCSRARCACICAGGDIIPSHWAHCGFLCV